MRTKEELLKDLADYVVNMEDEAIVDIAKEYLACGYPASEGILKGLTRGMERAGKLYDEEEYYIAELLICSDAMYAGLDVLKTALNETNENKIKAVIGVVEGDTHDIGKNLVKIMLETAGFEMIDLGRDVPLDDFVDTCIEKNASLLCMSSLMSTTMYGMKEVIEKLVSRGYRDKIKVMIGGGPITKSFASQIGADAYSENATQAVSVAKSLLGMA